MTRRHARFLALLSSLAGVALLLSVVPVPEVTPVSGGGKFRRLSRLPVYFIENRGQIALPDVRYYVQSRAAGAYFMSQGVVFALRNHRLVQPISAGDQEAPTSVIQQQFLDATKTPRLEASDQAGALVNYFYGSTRQPVTDVPTFTTVIYRDVWPGIDVSYTGPDGNLKYTFHVRAGADPRQIRFAYRGASSLRVTSKGSLHVETPAGGFTDDAPVAWQQVEQERKPVQAAFRLQGEEISFELGDYDRSRDLILDPAVLVYSGFVGGVANDQGSAIAVDSAGNAYVAGYTFSATGFPTLGAYDSSHNGGADVFVLKLNAAGTGLVYATYVGGSLADYAEGIAIDTAGNAYVTGYTLSSNFPTTSGAYDTSHNGGADIFAFKLSPAGNSLVYSTYIGGSAEDQGMELAIDSSGNAYIAGNSNSVNFPLSIGSFQGGLSDAIVLKVNANGTALLYSWMVGGSDNDSALGIAVNSAGAAYVTGYTDSSNFPTVVGPFLTSNGDYDAFIFALNPGGTAFTYSGLLGGSASDAGYAVAVDVAGNAYLTGSTESGNFPMFSSFNPIHGGLSDVFVAKVNASGTAIVYSTFLGGSSSDYGRGIAVDAVGNAYVVGSTYSTNFYVTTSGPDVTHNGSADAFIARLNAPGTLVDCSGFYGGSGYDVGESIAIDSSGAAYITGITSSTEATLPVGVGPDLTANGNDDAFVAKFIVPPGISGPVVVFRNGFNAIEFNTFPSPLLRNAAGNFRLNPSASGQVLGRVFVVARDSAVGLWINSLLSDDTFSGWVFAGGNSPGNPDVAAATGLAMMVFRDPWNAYWARSFTPGIGLGVPQFLGGIFATDPKIAGCPYGDYYIVGRDNWNGLWTRRFDSGSSSWQAWQFIGGITQGTPGIACGSDNAAYIAVRDNWNNMWLARVSGESSVSWYYGAGIWDGNLHAIANGSRIHVVGLSYSTPYYRTWQVGSGWTGPAVTPGGVLAHVSPAVYNGSLYLAGQDFSGNLFWWNPLTNTYTNFGNKNVASGSRFSGGTR
jgi:hypothetical protein